MKSQIKIFFLFALIALFYSSISAQKKIDLKFTTQEVEFLRGDAVSNILKVTNLDSSQILFTLTISHPDKWQVLGDKFKVYTLNPNDSLFLPVRLIPLGKIRGNTKYIINAYIFDLEINQPISSANFYVKKPRKRN